MLALSVLALTLSVSSVIDDPKQTVATPPAVANAPAQAASNGPTPQEIGVLISEFYAVLEKKFAGIQNPTQEEMTKIQAEVATSADAFFADQEIALEQLNDEQLSAFEPVIGMSPKARTIVIGLMNERAKQPTEAGFKAAVRAAMLSMQSAGDPMTSPVDIAVVLLAHPSAAAGLSGETGSMVLSMLEDATAAQLAPQAPMIAALAARFNPDATMETLQLSEAYLKIASKALSKEQFAATRAVVIACLTTKLATSEGREKQFLQRMAKSLNGAAARGELLGYPVPTLTCDWVMRADGTTPWKSISDLKGKVVVLDFWATWCGPCVGSFPNVAKLRDAYTPEQLEIVGITSLQGSVAHQKRERVDCKGDAEKEHAETLAFMTDMGVTWTIAITAEDVFNPDFGIRGIPFVAILDQDGKVFKVGMHAGDEAGIRAAVDELLAKKAAPAKS